MWPPRLARERLLFLLEFRKTYLPKPSSGTDLYFYGKCEFLWAVRETLTGKATVLNHDKLVSEASVLPFVKSYVISPRQT